MASCQFCYGENDELPKAPIIAMGTRSYLSCTLTEELVDGHCYIVPIQHHFCMLEADDDVWDEVRVSWIIFRTVNLTHRASAEFYEMLDTDGRRHRQGVHIL